MEHADANNQPIENRDTLILESIQRKCVGKGLRAVGMNDEIYESTILEIQYDADRGPTFICEGYRLTLIDAGDDVMYLVSTDQTTSKRYIVEQPTIGDVSLMNIVGQCVDEVDGTQTSSVQNVSPQDVSLTHFSNSELQNIIEKDPSRRVVAALRLIDNQPEGHELFAIMYNVSLLREQAWQLMGQSKKTRNIDLRTVMINLPEYRDRAARMQMKRDPSALDLAIIMEYHEPLCEQAWEMLLMKEPDERAFREIMDHVPAYAEQAARLWMQTEVGFHNIYMILKDFPTLCDEAWDLLTKKQPQKNILEAIIQFAPTHKERAQQMLNNLPSDDQA